jgi:glycosyltransferase involved in cell wall biosynthesis
LQIVNVFRDDPDIIHFVLSPTVLGLIIAKMISLIIPGKKIVISAIHPAINERKIYQLLAPDLILVQSKSSEILFSNLGFKTKIFPNGINIKKFFQYELTEKQQIRSKFKIPSDKFVILHLASITKERNLEILCNLQKGNDYQVLIIGRVHETIDLEIYTQLKKAGCTVWIEHFPKIEEIYNLADCYVFPTIEKKACIELPLSVLEAMACNIPVITTRFGALPNIFTEGDGLFYYENFDELSSHLKKIMGNELSVITRKKVIPFSWDNLVPELIKIYETL